MDKSQTLYAYNGAKHEIDFNASTNTQQTAALDDHVTVVRLLTDKDVYVTFETEKAATAANGLTVKAGVPEYFQVSGGTKLNALGVSDSGTLEIDEMTR